MERGITILLIDRSPITAVRMIEWLCSLKGVGVVYGCSEVGEGAAAFDVYQPQLVILTNHVSKPELIMLSAICRQHQCLLMVLSDYLHESYTQWCKSIGVDHLLDSTAHSMEVEQIIENIYTSMKDEYCEI